MKRFLRLLEAVDGDPGGDATVPALRDYFAEIPPAEAAWAVTLLSGHTPKRVATSGQLRAWAGGVEGLPEWLVEECVRQAGDTSEALALLLPPPTAHTEICLRSLMEEHLLPLAAQDEQTLRDRVLETWNRLEAPGRILWNKLLTGTLRPPVTRVELARVLAGKLDLPPAEIEHRIALGVEPTPAGWASLTSRDVAPGSDPGRPYPFHLGTQLEGTPESLGPPSSWSAEWHWDGLRAQVVHRRGQTRLLAQDGALLDDLFPEITVAADQLAEGTVLDGMVLAWGANGARAGADLRHRLALKSVSNSTLRKHPVVFMACDLLERDGVDLRAQPLEDRRRPLHGIAVAAGFRVSETLVFSTWAELAGLRAAAPAKCALGIMLKQRLAPYASGRERGAWWKWRTEPLTVLAVLLYAQGEPGECTFGLWKDREWVTVGKVSGSLGPELEEWIRRHTVDKFGPVRQVKPDRVAELRCHGIEPAPRSKAGFILRAPTLIAWRADLTSAQAGTLEKLRSTIGST